MNKYKHPNVNKDTKEENVKNNNQMQSYKNTIKQNDLQVQKHNKTKLFASTKTQFNTI
jgi:hypothetical protein